MAKKRNNVIRFSRKPDVNIGLILFIVIFVYIVISVFIFVFSKKTTIYQVSAGSLAYDNSFTGFIIRDEEVIKSDYSGNVNFFLNNGQRASIGTVVYSVDETGRVYDKIKASIDDELNSDEMTEIKNMLADFSVSYSASEFYNVYRVREHITDKIYEYQAYDIANHLEEYISDTESMDFFHPIEADITGLVSYVIDGYEAISETALTDTVFNQNDYTSTNLQNTELINQGDAAYKLVKSDVWYIYIQLDENQSAALSDSTKINLNFINKDIQCVADFSQITTGGKTYGRIELSKYMVNFIEDRYVQIEITENNISGLKVPVSAVFNKGFYTIPKEYLTLSGTFIRKYYNENGQIMTEAIDTTIYEENDKYYFVSMDDFKSGDILMLPDSDETYIVGTMDELTGVYCINKGYAVFKKVDILEQNEEYYIIRKGTTYGLAIYDHIVLDYTTIKEYEIIN